MVPTSNGSDVCCDFQNRSEMGKFFQQTVDSHRKSFDPSNIRDLVDTYLLEIEESAAQGRQMFGGRDPDRQIQQVAY